MIPVCLVTGFLGSGKTTLLQHIVSTNRERKLVYLINEFSPVDIDSQLIDVPEGRLVSIAGGSIFCKCLVSDFIKTLRMISDESNQAEGVVIETSGIANPKVVTTMLKETQLNSALQVKRIISVIDPGAFLKLAQTLPNIVEQVEASDLLVLNKTDAYPTQTIEQAKTELRRINPNAHLETAQYCKVDLDLFPEKPITELHGEYAKCADPNYAEVALKTNRIVDWEKLKQAVMKIGDDVLRLKGFVNTATGKRFIDYSGSGWVETAAPDAAQPTNGMVLIVRGRSKILADTLAVRMKKGEFSL